YEEYLPSSKSVLVLDELSEEIDYASSSKGSMRKLYERMRSSNTALVMPLFGRGKSVTHLLISSHKIDNKLFSNEEISALQTLLVRIQSTIEADRKVRQSRALANSIAHEMRNPLSGLCTSIDVIQSILPNMKEAGKEQYVMSVEDVTLLREVSQDAMNIIQSGNETIDLLLTSIDENRVSRSSFKKYSVHSVVEQAIESFSYKRATDRFAISLDARSVFEFLGSDTLLKYFM
ncbi:hybrid sensor histidine kinase/response regulator, partial [Vibrio parahaemolyticus]|nr:hybrid sensor histidine kinase/response regulator [Vibrio parahaemolyticus]